MFRSVVVFVLIAVGVRGDDLSWSEAREIINGKRVVFMGDSVQRYCFFNLNYWLQTGETPEDEYDSAWGNNDEDYNTDLHDDVWNTDGLITDRGTHRQWLSQDYPDLDDAYLTFYFVQDVWYDDIEDEIKDDILNNYDVLVWNTGWWRLKVEADPSDCGSDWTDECADEWDDSLEEIKDNLFDEFIDNGNPVLLRSSTCCGEDDDYDWVDSIEEQNDATKDFFDGESGYTYVNVYDLVDTDNADDKLFDGTHMNRDTCLEFNKIIIQAADDVTQRSGSSGGDSGGDSDSSSNYSPTYVPTSAPGSENNYAPTYKPTPSTDYYTPTYQPTTGEEKDDEEEDEEEDDEEDDEEEDEEEEDEEEEEEDEEDED